MKLIRNLSLVFVAFLSLILVTGFVNAQTDAQTVQENANTTVDYALPYPGMLPDNILYPLKIVRDRLIEFLTVDPLKKGEFYLLQADKRLASGQALFDKKKYLLGEQTISKGEKYFLAALKESQTAKTKGKDINDLQNRMKKASLKHEQVINFLLTKTPKEFQTGLKESLNIVKQIEKSLAVPKTPATSAVKENTPAPSSGQTAE